VGTNRTRRATIFGSLAAGLVTLACLTALSKADEASAPREAAYDSLIENHAARLLREGREAFRFDTFGSEDFWGGKLRLHEAVAGLSPAAAAGLGLKIDAQAVPEPVQQALRRGEVNLNNPAVTLQLLKLDAVIGVKGFFGGDGNLRSIGIRCALCHSAVDRSFQTAQLPPGVVGNRLDGWPARDLNVGAIIALAPTVKPFADLLGVSEDTVRSVLRSWGPGKFDAELILDGKAFRPDGKPAATLMPAAFGLAGISQHTYTGWGGISHWNAFVANLEMQGKGTFWDPRLNDATQFPIAARAGMADVRNTPDLITPKLAALHMYQLSLPAPQRARNPFEPSTAPGEALFNGKAQCARCHVPPIYTEPGWNMHTPAEIGIDDFQANRSPDRRYRTTPLRGMIAKQRGGFYHDGRFPTMLDVINHYDQQFQLGLSEAEKRQLADFVGAL
jgi:hypothetical protein